MRFLGYQANQRFKHVLSRKMKGKGMLTEGMARLPQEETETLLITNHNMETKFKRILLKLSGESLMGKKQYGIDEERLAQYAAQIKEIHEMGVQIGIVIGGGNIFRGLSGASRGFDRVKGDQMGMLATVINSLALSSARKLKIPWTIPFCAPP